MREAGITGLPSTHFDPPRGVEQWCGLMNSRRSPTELGDSQEVVAGGDQVGVHLHPLATAIGGTLAAGGESREGAPVSSAYWPSSGLRAFIDLA